MQSRSSRHLSQLDPVSRRTPPTQDDKFFKVWESEADRMAHRYCTATCDKDNLKQIGRITVWECLNRYDPKRGPFEHYARKAMKLAMLKARNGHSLRNMDCIPLDTPHTNSTSAPPTVVDKLSVTKWQLDEVREAEKKQAEETLAQGRFDECPPQIKQVLLALYWKQLSQVKIAQTMQLSQQRVAQLHQHGKQFIANNLATVA